MKKQLIAYIFLLVLILNACVATPAKVVNENPLVLEKVTETESGYVLIGKFRSIGLPQGAQAVSFSNWPKITDADGKEIQFTQTDPSSEKIEQGIFPWVFEIKGKQFKWPLTIKLDLVAVKYENVQTKFEFDTEAKPPDEQVQELDALGNTTNYPIWNLDINLGLLAGYPVRVFKAIRRADGYEFYFKSTAVFHGVDVQIQDSTQGMTGMNGPDEFSSAATFAGKVPSGKLKVLVTHPVVAIPGFWELQWKPENQ